jgi:hypothetical protein
LALPRVYVKGDACHWEGTLYAIQEARVALPPRSIEALVLACRRRSRGNPSDDRSSEDDPVSTTAVTFAARFLGLSLVTWLVIILLVIVVAVAVSRRRV